MRPVKDDDLRRAIEQLPDSTDISDLLRDALRAWFFGGQRMRTIIDDVEIPMPTLSRVEKSDDELTCNLDDLINGF